MIPGGVNSPVRAFAAVGGTPLFIDRGSGAHVWDVDGHRYVDLVMSWGPLIHGHAYSPVVEAIEAAARRGTSFGTPTRAEVQLARLVTRSIPSVELVRFVSSGTEASMSAIRLARGHTGRDLIVKFAGNYHGHVDWLLAQAGSGALTLGVPTSPGVPASAAAQTLVARYNEPHEVRDLFARAGDDIAAVIVEPIAGNMGVVPPEPEFLAAIQSCCRAAGSLFICDEVITGFRVAAGGAQSLYSLEPDLSVLGKIIGGGLPVGAYGGRREIMQSIAPLGPVYQAGTLSGNPLAMAAGIATLESLQDPAVYRRLETQTRALRVGLEEAARASGTPVWINACTGMLTVFFAEHPVASLAAAEASDTAAYARFFHAMLDRGVYLPPSQFEAWMVSTAHDDDDLELILNAAAEAFKSL